MTTESRNQLKKVMQLAWQFVKRNGSDLSTALKRAWANIRLVKAMRNGIVKFYYTKVDGTLREAYGTLRSDLLPPTSAHRDIATCQTYYDTEKQAWRCFKKFNIA